MTNHPRPRIVVDLETAPIDGAASFIEPPTAPSNYGEKAAAAYVEKETAKLIDKAALDIDLARIVALGWQIPGTDIQVELCVNENDEATALDGFSSLVRYADTVTFNGLGYDLPLIERRLRYLGLPPLRWNLNKYRTNHIDLAAILSQHGTIRPWHSLAFYRKRLGLEIDDPIDGKDVPQAVAEGRWTDVEAHCRADIETTAKVAQWLGEL